MIQPIKVHILHCGRVRVDRAVPFREKTFHPFPWTGVFRSDECQMWLPVAVYLIEHPKGLVLYDTGWHSEVRLDPTKHLGRLHYKASKPDLPSNQAIHEQLAQRGIKTSDLDWVIISHLDSDHVDGLRHVADAKNILVSQPEWKSANHRFNIRYRREMWDDVKLSTFQFQPSPYGPQKSAFDLFGDESVMLIHAPGHSAGMTAAMVQAHDKFVLITGDSAYAKKSWEQMISPGITPDVKKARESLEWIAMMSRQPECVEILAPHDPAVIPHTIEL